MGFTRAMAVAVATWSMAGQAAAFPVERCINLGAALEAPAEGDWGYVIEAAHLGTIAAAGFDTVRLPVRFDAHFRDGAFDPALLARVDEVIGWARAAGLQVILDLHHFDAFMADPRGETETLLAMWDVLGLHYAGAPDDLMFEILNEPHDAVTTDWMAGVNARAVARLRQLHPTRWIVTGGAMWNDAPELARLPPPGPYEARTFHFYDPWPFTHQQAPYVDDPPPPSSWGTPEDHAALRARIARAAGNAGPLLLGEFGTYDAGPEPDRLAWTRAVREAAEAEGIAWCYWGFSQGEEPGFKAHDADGWLPGFPEVLIPG